MPCNLGYRSVARARVQPAAPRSFAAVTPAPAVDDELLDRLGVEDPVFRDWLLELDLDPLLERALAAARPPADLEVAVRGGALRVRAPAGGDRRAVEERVARLGRRWQMEVLRVVGELLGYRLTLEQSGDGFVLEGEKTDAGPVAPYLRISAGGDDAEVRFEHFESEDALALEEIRLVALAQRLGVRLRLGERRRAGQPIAAGAVHPHRHPGKKGRS